MSQSATLHRVSETHFREMEKNGTHNDQSFYNISKSYVTFQKSFDGLQFVLSKKEDEKTIKLVSQIFNPDQSLGEIDFEQLTDEEIFEIFENGGIKSYLDKETVFTLNQFLKTVSVSVFLEKYDAGELNRNNIYPEVWSHDNSKGVAFNDTHLEEDFVELKGFFEIAAEEGDYIFSFVG